MDTPLNQLKEAMSHFDTAMLVTHDESLGLRARPLTLADHAADGSLWFLTSRESGKVVEVKRDARVAVVMQDSRRFVSVSGSANLDASLERRRELWRPSFRPWFPNGAEDANTLALQVVPTSAELWDLSGKRGLEYALHALGAVLSGERASDDAQRDFHVQVQDGFER